jgi:DNA-binding MarR family transcriptional regulator
MPDYDIVQSLKERFRAAYWRVLHDLDALRLQQWEQSQLTLPQLRVLFSVRRSPGITTGQLARLLGITVSTTSGLVTKLVDAGLVVRRSREGDRRQIPLELTDAGLSLAGELAEVTRPFVDDLAQELGPGLEQIVTGLEALAEAAARMRER